MFFLLSLIGAFIVLFFKLEAEELKIWNIRWTGKSDEKYGQILNMKNRYSSGGIGGLEIDQMFIVVVALFVGLLTLFSMTKIWNEAFWKDDPRGSENILDDSFSSVSISKKVLIFSPIIVLALITIIIGFNAEPFLNIANNAAEQLLNPSEYISKVLGL